jgi:hypothetical protein
MIILNEDQISDEAELASWLATDVDGIRELVAVNAIREPAPGNGMFGLVASIKAVVEFYGGSWESVPTVGLNDVEPGGQA